MSSVENILLNEDEIKTFSDKSKLAKSAASPLSLHDAASGKGNNSRWGSAPQEGARNLGNCKHMSKSKR